MCCFQFKFTNQKQTSLAILTQKPADRQGSLVPLCFRRNNIVLQAKCDLKSRTESSCLSQIVFSNFCGTRGCACNFVLQCGQSVYSSLLLVQTLFVLMKILTDFTISVTNPWAIRLIVTNQRSSSYQAQSNWQLFGGIYFNK